MKRALLALALLLGCGGGGEDPPACELPVGTAPPDYLQRLGCQGDFAALASQPLDATIPGARSVKVVLDQSDKDALYFQNSGKYKIHFEFASKNLSGPKHPLVPALVEFNRTQYTSSERRFVLGAVTYYEGPKVWALELAPYDTASPAMITKLYDAVRKVAFFGDALYFHPTSQTIESLAAMLAAGVRIKTTDDLFAATDYQPLNLGESIGRLRFVQASDLVSTYVGFRDIVVLDHVPNDISVVAGLITEEFQTPLSHVNVLAQTRKTPNMGLRKATTNTQLRALDGKWVKLTVGAFVWSASEVSQADADAFWEAHKPKPVKLPEVDLTVTDLRNIEDVVVEGKGPLREAIQLANRAFGAKASGYSILAKTEKVPTKKAFGVPAAHYMRFMQQNGFFARVDALLADPEFTGKPEVRDAKLRELRDAMRAAPVDATFSDTLKAKLLADFPEQTMRFRSSTNAEDLEGFPCAGCYDSHTGDPAAWDADLLMAVKKTWATVWKFRTFEERAYHGIDHKGVGMALLVHHNFPKEEANGVAATANPFDPSGLEPGFYVNVQKGGDAEVVAPPPGVFSDEIIYHWSYPGQPAIYLSHSSLVPAGTTVLDDEQLYQLGTALDAIHTRFAPAFGPASGNRGFYALEVDFKFDDEAAPGQPPSLYIKQARPYPGRGM